MKKTLTIATRKSPLALWQANHVKELLIKSNPGLQVELIKISTKGDKILDSPLAKIGGKGLFIKELQVAMLQEKADIAVHSIKDMPYQSVPNLKIGAILKRENPFDAFVSNNFSSIAQLPYGAKVGTCSMRRIVQLKAIRSDLQIIDLRGNVNTRLQKLDDNQYDAIILACAGLIRLGLAERITAELSPQQSLPAVGQGAIAIEIRADDAHTLDLITPLEDFNTKQIVLAERAMNARLEGGCESPIAAFATIDDNIMTINGLVGNVQTGTIIKQQLSANVDDYMHLGEELADKLLFLGAKDILKPLG